MSVGARVCVSLTFHRKEEKLIVICVYISKRHQKNAQNKEPAISLLVLQCAEEVLRKVFHLPELQELIRTMSRKVP